MTLSLSQVGLVGYGSIGKACGRAVKGAFGSRIIALRRQNGGGGGNDDDEGPADAVFGPDAKLAFFAACDFVISSLPSTPETLRFIGPAEIAAMKPTAVLVSLGRGAVLDEAALAGALRAGTLKGAVLDVFATEPLPAASPLWDLENVLLTAHNADYTEDYFELGWAVWAENLAAFAKGSPTLATPVDLLRGY